MSGDVICWWVDRVMVKKSLIDVSAVYGWRKKRLKVTMTSHQIANVVVESASDNVGEERVNMALKCAIDLDEDGE
jgi:hypothetical protein